MTPFQSIPSAQRFLTRHTPLIWLTIFGASFGRLAAAESKTVDAPVDAVTVFLSQAQVQRTGSFRLPEAGQYELIVEGLSAQIQPASLQVQGLGNFTILEVGHQVDYRMPEVPELPQELRRTLQRIQSINDSLRIAGYAQEVVSARRQALTVEKNVLLANPVMNGGPKADTLPALKEALLYLRLRLENIHQAMAEAHAEEDRWQTLRSGLSTRLQTEQQRQRILEQKRNQPASAIQQVRVTVLAKQAISGKIAIRYLVAGAGWQPAYDVRSNGPGKPVDLTYKAYVHQSTGVDWKGVALTLTTNNPSRSQVKPVLPVWYARFYEQRAQLQTLSTMSGAPQPVAAKSLDAAVLETDAYFMAQDEVAANIAADYTQMTQTFANIEFAIDLPYDIPASGEQRLILVAEHELAADYRHYMVPKLDDEAFIEAQVTGWEDLQLMPGSANIFYDGTYVGSAPLNPDIFADTLELPMGRDRLVRGERKRLDHEEKNKAFTGDRVRTERWELSVRNGHAVPIRVQLLDQIPVAASEGIDVSLEEGAPDRQDPDTGRLTWRLAVPARTTAERVFAYRLRWDKDRTLLLR